MKKTFVMAIAAILMSSVAMADDYDNTAYSISADSSTWGLSLTTGNTVDYGDDAQTLDIHTNGNAVNVGVTFVETGTDMDYRFSASSTANGELAYLTVGMSYDWGDNFATEELRFSPIVGVEKTIGEYKPFAELGYDYKSLEGNYLDFDAADSHATVGVSYNLTESATITATTTREMNKDFDKTDQELGLGFAVKF